MRILSKYILKQHVPPFVFALTALTLLLLLDQVSERFGDLVGKGLDWHVIAEVFALSIPFILAMTLPMAVLIAVLYTFNRLASDNEITAMKANGVHLPRLLLPLGLVATLLAGGMIVFNNTILPDSNHRLQALLTEINRKKPTFALKERTVNEVKPRELYLRTGRIDRPRSMLRDVAIYDQRQATRPRTTYADSALMAYSRDRTDLYLTLHEGVTHEWRRDRPGSFQRIFFRKQIMKVPDVTNRLNRGSAGGYRGDREMSIGEMQVEVDSADARASRVRRSSQAYTWAATRYLLGDSVRADETEYLDFVYGRGQQTRSVSAGSRTLERRAAAESLGVAPDSLAKDSPRAAPDSAAATPGDSTAAGTAVAARADSAPGQATRGTGTTARDSLLLARARTAFEVSEFRIGLRGLRSYRDESTVTSRFDVFASLLDSALQRRSRFAVEIQKKLAIPVACVVFVLIGAPIAVRYPLGGVGMVVGVSFGFFCAYYVALVGGEELADRLILSPFWAMWAPNILFGSVGLGFVWRAIKVG
ncbi:MAG: LptF/LptG family permease [Candidatus Palauibacterales bacterium]|nr:LptF/LptG family permease [Candidatus Palauibacterales bacterium]